MPVMLSAVPVELLVAPAGKLTTVKFVRYSIDGVGNRNAACRQASGLRYSYGVLQDISGRISSGAGGIDNRFGGSGKVRHAFRSGQHPGRIGRIKRGITSGRTSRSIADIAGCCYTADACGIRHGNP